MTDRKWKFIWESGFHRSKKTLALGLILLILIVSATLGVAKGIATVLIPTSIPQPLLLDTPEVPVIATARPLSPDALYMVVSNALLEPPLDLVSRILALDPESGELRADIWSRYRPEILPSPDNTFLYVLDNYQTRVIRGEMITALTAIEVETQQAVWEITLPGQRAYYLSYPAKQSMWNSANGQLIYLQMSSH